VSHGCDNANDEKVLQLKDTVGVSGDNRSQNFKNDDYEENVIDGLDHSGWKERVRLKNTDDRRNQGGRGDSQQKDAEDDVKDFFDSLDPVARNNELVLFGFLCHE
jgi:hypothetical protein